VGRQDSIGDYEFEIMESPISIPSRPREASGVTE
jgi:hypothetical protein